MPKTTTIQRRHWIGTYHIDSVAQFDTFWETIQNNNVFNAAAAQVEKCPTTERLHVQFYVSCNPKQRFNSLKSKLGDTVHLEPCADALASWEYCTKEDTRVLGPKTKGEKPHRAGDRYEEEWLDRIFRLELRLRGIVPNKKTDVTNNGF